MSGLSKFTGWVVVKLLDSHLMAIKVLSTWDPKLKDPVLLAQAHELQPSAFRLPVNRIAKMLKYFILSD